MRISEYMLRKFIRAVLVEKKFSELPGYAKNKEMDIYDDLIEPENDELRDEVFDLIDNSYSYLGGNVDIRNPDDLMDKNQNDYDPFFAWDIDEDPQPDVVRGAKPKSGSMKLALSANDGSATALDFSKNDTINRLKKGHWAEMSGKSASMAMKAGVPAITDQKIALKYINKPNVVWHGEHPYFSNPDVYRDLAIEAEKSKSRATFNGQYDGWYERELGGHSHVKMVFGS